MAMLRAGGQFRHSLRWAVLSLAAITAAGILVPDTADARTRRHRKPHAPAAERYNPPYAAIVVDANTGAVLHASSADSPRHPASLTKIMTLYLLFEQLEAGKIKLSSELPVSEHAAAQAPSKLALKPGESISVEHAIRAIVTKSANDVAVIVAEALGGSESQFARQMTQKARSLGMKNTLYRNASGLPDGEQITTAQDQILLGRAIQDRFPKYYRYFSAREFTFRGKSMRNHNKLLGAVAGVDGIKTGYTNASGFNLVSSVRRGNRHLVAAVFGGRTASWRDARMRDLISQYIGKASQKRTTAPVHDKPAADPAPEQKAKPGITMANTAAASEPALGSTDPIKANTVKTVTVRAATMKGGAMLASPAPQSGLTRTPLVAKGASLTTVSTVKTEPPAGTRTDSDRTLSVKLASVSDVRPEPASSAPAKARGGWLIQIGAFDVESEAKQRLLAAQKQAKDVLQLADPYTERVSKGDKTLYRARFAGFDKEQAENACKHLRRGEIPCMLLKN